MAKRRKTSWQGVTVVLPKGASKLSQRHKDAIDGQVTAVQWSAAKGGKCRYVFFTASRGALRCDRNRGTSTRAGGMSKAAKRRFKRMGGKRSCMKKVGKGRQFKRC